MSIESTKAKPASDNEHLKQLRDHLNLPFNTLTGDQLVFALMDTHNVIVRCVNGTHLTLICELAKLDSIPQQNWQTLALSLSSIYNREFPASLLTVERQLGVVWTCRSDIAIDKWLELAQGALSWVVELVKKG